MDESAAPLAIPAPSLGTRGTWRTHALAVVAALLRSFTPFSFVVWYIVGAALGTVFFSPRRWRRGQAQVHPAGSDTQN